MRRVITILSILVIALSLVPLFGVGPAQAKPDATVVFAAIGDQGTGDTNSGYVATMVGTWSPNFIITSGDNRYGTSSQYDDTAGRDYCSYIKDGGTGDDCAGGTANPNKFFPSLGNHDYDGDSSASRYLSYFTLPGTGFSNTSGNERYYDFVNGPVHFFVINSYSTEPDGTSNTSTQGTWLQTQLANSTSTWNVVYFHHPAYSSGSHGDNSYMQWPFESWGADVVFQGHDHIYERLEKNGFRYFVSGNGGRPLYACGSTSSAANSEYCYGSNGTFGGMRVNASDSTMTFEALSIDDGANGSNGGTVIDTFQLEANSTCTTVESSVSANSDDAEENQSTGAMNYTSTDLEMVSDGSTLQYVGMRFQNITVPQGATIQNAYIEFTARYDETGATDLIFKAQDVDNAGTFTSSSGNISGRSLTTASVSWESIPDWDLTDPTRTKYQTPGLATVLQEVVDRSGWSSGNALAFIVDGSGERTAYSWDHSTQDPPKLVVEYCEGADIGDTVWWDKDEDGVQDAGEDGISGITVNLRNSSGDSLVATTTTNSNGNYGFSSIATGNYYVEVIKPSNYAYSPKYATGATTPTGKADDSDVDTTTDRTDAFAWTSGGSTLDIDAGLVTFCLDTELEATADNWIEDGNPTFNYGVDTTLVADGSGPASSALLKWDLASIPSGSKINSASVRLDIVNISEGAVYEFYQLLRNWTEGTGDTSATGDGATWNTYDGTNNWGSSGADAVSDRGSTILGTISNTSTGWDTEALNSSGVGLIQEWLDGTTDNYGLIIQDYTNTASGEGMDFSSRETTNRPTLLVNYCVHPDNVDVGDSVWEDYDKDGIQDSGEPAIGGVTVRLYADDDSTTGPSGGDTLVDTTVSTSGNSYYLDGAVNNGTYYYVQFVLTTGYAFSPKDQGTDDTVDSDVNTATGYTDRFLWTGRTLDVDAGMHKDIDTSQVCWGVADNNPGSNRAGPDALYTLDITDASTVKIGDTGTGVGIYYPGIEALSYNVDNDTLYAPSHNDSANEGILVTLDQNTGAYTRVHATNTIGPSDSPASRTLEDVDGLAFDQTGTSTVLWGAVRISADDLLIQIDYTTGQHVNNAFTSGTEDYVSIDCPQSVDADVDDIAINPANGLLYGICDTGATSTAILATITKTTGATSPVGATGVVVLSDGTNVQDIEGMSFTGSGELLASTGNAGNIPNRLYKIDLSCDDGPTSNQCLATEVGQFDSAPADVDYEGLACENVTQQVTFDLGSIGNYVWVDENSDGHQDAGEPGIPNVKVELTGTDLDGNPINRTTYTDAHGGYTFTDLPAGTYTISVDTSTLPDSSLNNWTGPYAGQPSGAEFGNQDPSGYTVSLGRGKEDMSADFGFNYNTNDQVNGTGDPSNGGTGNGVIGDKLWVDADGDGVQDPEEIGLENVDVELYDSGPDGIFDPGTDGIYGTTDDDSVLIQSDTTDANGNYIFDNVTPDAYVVQVDQTTLPGGFTQTGDPDQPGTTCTICDHMTTTPIVLAPGDVYLNADFGYKPEDDSTGSIGDTVWLDLDADGIIDTNEYGIPGVTVALIKDTNGNGQWDAGEPIIATDTTDGSGNYLFSGLPVTDGTGTDDYLVWVNDTDSVLLGKDAVYDADGTSPAAGLVTGLGISAVADLTTTPVTNQDFGYAPHDDDRNDGENGIIGDTIFIDSGDGAGGAPNGSPDPGEGREGVVVQLYDSSGNILLATTTTDENGHYYFGDLDTTQSYVVRVATGNFNSGGALVGMSNTVDPDGGNDNQSSVTSFTSGANLDQDFGYQPPETPNTISGTLWQDTDADGTLDGTEPGRFSGVTVVLLDTKGNVVATTTTDGSGDYSFPQLPDGTYQVHVTDEAGTLGGYWKSDGPNDGNDGNSQDDPYIVTVGGGQTNTTADFGFYREPAAIGDFVWSDTDHDGIQDTGEPGIPNIEVTLDITYPNGDTITLITVTDSSGYYSFDNLLLDESYDGVGTPATPGVGGGVEPVFVVSVDTNQPGLTGYVPTLVDQGDGTNDSRNPSGTSATVTRGKSNANNKMDFGFDPDPTGVSISTFTVSLQPNNTVRIYWVTENETNIIGFNIQRSTSAGGVRVQLNQDVIEPENMGASWGASYERIDADVQGGVTYYYWLEVLVTSGGPDEIGPESIAIPLVPPPSSHKVYLPMTIK